MWVKLFHFMIEYSITIFTFDNIRNLSKLGHFFQDIIILDPRSLQGGNIPFSFQSFLNIPKIFLNDLNLR